MHASGGRPQRPLRPAQKPNFTVHLRRCGRGASATSDIRSLVAALPAAPAVAAFPDPCGELARLDFVQWCDALEAVVWLWERRLRGAEGWRVRLTSAVAAVSDEDELDGRVRPLFAEFVAGVMEGEAVRGWRKRAAALAEEIEAAAAALRRRNNIGSFGEVSARREGLRREKALVERKLEEFRSAMGCVMGYLDEERRAKHCDGGVRVLSLEERVDWNCLYHRILRECRRLEEGLPIYAYRREILNEIYCGQVYEVAAIDSCSD